MSGRERPGASAPPEHDEERARSEFRLRTADDARQHALNRLLQFLVAHPGARPVLRHLDEAVSPDE
jgi:hypothetical protein